LVRELERKLPEGHSFGSKLKLFQQVLNQNKTDKNKIYSLHETEVCCISKGKAHKKYEFGNKVSLAVTQETNVIVGALSFRNPFDGHTFEQAVEQVRELTGKYPSTASVDRGYRGVKPVGSTVPILPSPEKDEKLSTYQRQKKRLRCRKRAAIEPIIGHLKTDFRLSRNFYKSTLGDNINVLLAASAFNFKRMINHWKSSFCVYFLKFIERYKITLKIFFVPLEGYKNV